MYQNMREHVNKKKLLPSHHSTTIKFYTVTNSHP